MSEVLFVLSYCTIRSGNAWGNARRIDQLKDATVHHFSSDQLDQHFPRGDVAAMYRIPSYWLGTIIQRTHVHFYKCGKLCPLIDENLGCLILINNMYCHIHIITKVVLRWYMLPSPIVAYDITYYGLPVMLIRN